MPYYHGVSTKIVFSQKRYEKDQAKIRQDEKAKLPLQRNSNSSALAGLGMFFLIKDVKKRT